MPLLWVSVAFLLGLAAGALFNIHWAVWLALACLFLTLAFLDPLLCKRVRFWDRFRGQMPVSAGVLLLLVALGGLRFWATHIPLWQPDNAAWYNDKGSFTFTGWVAAAPDRRDDMTVYQIELIEIQDPANPDWMHATQKISGRAQVFMPVYAAWEYGDLLQFSAKPRTPSDNRDFSYREYLAGLDIHTVIYYPAHVQQVGSGYGSALRGGLIALREKAHQTIFAIYPQPESGLLSGILLGMDNDLPQSLAQSYRDTGVSHIIAISGFNMAVLSWIFLLIFARLVGPYWAAVITGILLTIYTFFVDGSPSVVRALIMAVMGAGGQLIGRRKVGLNALCFTAAVMCLFDPLLLKNISFQLSFSATFGLVVFAQPMQDWLEQRLPEKLSAKLTRPLSEYFLVGLAAQFAVLPVIAYHFGRVSVSSLLANPLVLPVQPLVLQAGALTTLAGMIHPLAGKILMVFSWPLLKYTNSIVEWLARIKGGVLTIHPSFAFWILIVTVLFVALFFLRQKIKKKFHTTQFMWSVFFLVCAIFTVWSIYLHKPDGRLHLRLLRCEDEVTLLLQSPAGEVLLLDPRGNMNELTSSLEKRLSPWEFHVDAVLLTDRKGDTALSKLVERIPVKEALLAPAGYRTDSDEYPMMLPEGIEIEKLSTGQSIHIEDGVSVSLVSEDLQGTALLLEFGTARVLIPNGVDYAVIKTDAPDAMQGLTALVLGLEDLSYIPPRVWTQLAPGVILWDDVSLSPFVDSYGLDSHPGVSLVSDGVESWMEE